MVSSCGEVRRKVVVFGDQGLVGLARRCVSSRSDEKAPDRLNSLIPQPQDWHAKKVGEDFKKTDSKKFVLGTNLPLNGM